MDEPDFTTTVHLVQAVQRGESGADEEFVRRYLPYVRQIVALRMGWHLRQIMEIDDVVQDALLRVLRGIDRFDHGSEGSFRNWLASCVRREVVDQTRGATRQKRGGGQVRRFGDLKTSLSPALFAEDGPTPSELASASELSERIEAALLDMPEAHRELIVLRTMCSMSFAEIAEALGLSKEGTVRVAFSRALGKLRDRVGLS